MRFELLEIITRMLACQIPAWLLFLRWITWTAATFIPFAVLAIFPRPKIRRLLKGVLGSRGRTLYRAVVSVPGRSRRLSWAINWAVVSYVRGMYRMKNSSRFIFICSLSVLTLFSSITVAWLLDPTTISELKSEKAKMELDVDRFLASVGDLERTYALDQTCARQEFDPPVIDCTYTHDDPTSKSIQRAAAGFRDKYVEAIERHPQSGWLSLLALATGTYLNPGPEWRNIAPAVVYHVVVDVAGTYIALYALGRLLRRRRRPLHALRMVIETSLMATGIFMAALLIHSQVLGGNPDAYSLWLVELPFALVVTFLPPRLAYSLGKHVFSSDTDVSFLPTYFREHALSGLLTLVMSFIGWAIIVYVAWHSLGPRLIVSGIPSFSVSSGAIAAYSMAFSAISILSLVLATMTLTSLSALIPTSLALGLRLYLRGLLRHGWFVIAAPILHAAFIEFVFRTYDLMIKTYPCDR